MSRTRHARKRTTHVPAGDVLRIADKIARFAHDRRMSMCAVDCALCCVGIYVRELRKIAKATS
jgi:hypothetical protein